MSQTLSTTDHATDKLGQTYVYAVLSRRVGGVSVGINLNPNRACNFRCAYCQVEGLVKGAGPNIDLDQLERELHSVLDKVTSDNWLRVHAPEGKARLVSIAFSGDGEPTTSPTFAAAVERVVQVRRARGLESSVELILITNGTQSLRASVQEGLAILGGAGGEVWFKLDRGRDEDIARVNGTNLGRAHALRCLRATVDLCQTKIQTCWMCWDDALPSDAEKKGFLDILSEIRDEKLPIRGVLLYGLARPSHQPEATRLSAAPAEWMRDLGACIEALRFSVEVST